MSDSYTQPYYYLPTHLAFLNSTRWLNFWDILYYTAYQQYNPLLPLANNCAILTMTTSDFSKLLFAIPPGATLSTTQRESGRKTFALLLSLAHQYGLLLNLDANTEDMSEVGYDDDWQALLEAGPLIRHRFKLPLYQAQSAANRMQKWLAKPNSYIENGWIRTIGGSSSLYSHHLLNLWFLSSSSASVSAQIKPGERPSLQSEAEALLACYAHARKCLPDGFKQSIKTVLVLQRQLTQARSYLQGWGLLNSAGEWDNQLLEARPACSSFLPQAANQHQPLSVRMEVEAAVVRKLHTATSDNAEAAVVALLAVYAQKDKLRAARLQRLWATGLLEAQELKAVWRSLVGFWGESEFGQLQWALSQRERVTAAGRHLSWAAVVDMARVVISKRGQRNPVRPVSFASTGSKATGREIRPVRHGLQKLALPLECGEPLIKFIQPRLHQFVNDPRSLGRVRLEGWAHVPNWRSFASCSTVATAEANSCPQPVWIVIRLLDAQGKLIFADEPRLICPTQATSQWKAPLDRAFVRDWWRTQDFSARTANEPNLPLFWLEIEQVQNTNTPVSPPNVPASLPPNPVLTPTWFSVGLCLTFFPRYR